jgi:flagellar biosynthesis protein FlhF
MYVKSYRGKNAEECIQKLKADMGREAVILQSRTVRSLFGKFGPSLHEITAASDVNTVVDKIQSKQRLPEREMDEEPRQMAAVASGGGTATAQRPRLASGRMSLAEAAEVYERSGVLPSNFPVPPPAPQVHAAAGPAPVQDDRISQLEKQLSALTDALSRGTQTPAQPEPRPISKTDNTAGIAGLLRYRVPAEPVAAAPVQPAPAPARQAADPYQYFMDQLRKAQVADPIIRRIRSEIPAGLRQDEAASHIHDLIARQMLIGGTLGPVEGKMTVAALLGPTGVGKTTTIAKLAAHLGVAAGIPLGLITLDTQRVAATAQLQTYGDILGLPVRVAYDKAEMEQHLAEFAEAGMQIVLIDTPGRGPSETLSLAEMSVSLRSVVNLKSYLVIPGTLSGSNFENTIVRFTKLANPSAIIMSKMDETADNQCLGYLLNAQAKYQLPLAYITTGSRVPDDLLIADAHVLVTKLMATSVMES